MPEISATENSVIQVFEHCYKSFVIHSSIQIQGIKEMICLSAFHYDVTKSLNRETTTAGKCYAASGPFY